MQVIYLILLIDSVRIHSTECTAHIIYFHDPMCECERLCCVRARVNIYLVADWLEVEKFT